mgnify:CR=1 FL=1
MSDFKTEGQSEWDQRQSFMMRLHNHIVSCSEANQYRDYNQWLRSIISLKIDLSAHISEDDMIKIDNKITKCQTLINSRLGEYDKIKLLSEIQQLLHKVMRSKSFDVPIKESSPGSIILNDRSY